MEKRSAPGRGMDLVCGYNYFVQEIEYGIKEQHHDRFVTGTVRELGNV